VRAFGIRGRCERGRGRLTVNRWVAFVASSLALGVVTVLVVAMLREVLPPLVPMPARYVENRGFTLSGESPRLLQALGEGLSWTDPRPPLRVRLTMNSSSGGPPAEWRDVPPGVTGPQVLAWMRKHGVTADDVSAAIEAPQLARLAQDVRVPHMLLARGTSSATSASPSGARVIRYSGASRVGTQAVETILRVAGVFAWLAGVAFLWRRGRGTFASR
jgi:hypothetical protein